MDFAKKRVELLAKTKEQLGKSVGADQHIMQLLATIDDLLGHLNQLSKRLREWHGYILPEADHALSDHETFVRLVATKTLPELKEEFGAAMASPIDPSIYETIQSFASEIQNLYKLKENLTAKLTTMMQEAQPNIAALAGATIGARLLAGAGSSRKLAILPASTIQLLGAETALFRHLRTGARSPKYGFLYNHPLVQKAKSKGKAARMLADKLALCAKLDFFKGEFLAPEYLKDLEARIV